MDDSLEDPIPGAVQRFTDLPDRTPRPGVRRVVLDLLGTAAPLLGRGASALRRPRLQILNVHHVFPDEEEGFRRLLDWLVESGHELVGYGEGVAALRDGTLSRPSVAFTFDDGLASCLRAAAVLEDYGARGCFFVVTSMVGEGDPERVARFCRERIHMPPVAFMGWDDLAALRASGHEVGSHTHTHPVLAEVGAAEAAEEIERSREVLRARLGEARHFSWPRGRFHHFTAEAAAAVFGAGFESCASAERGAHVLPAPAGREALCLRRDHAIAAWPLAHHRWFLGQAARAARPENNRWPPEWDLPAPSAREGS